MNILCLGFIGFMLRSNVIIFVDDVDVANTLWTFYMQNLPLWKIFANLVCTWYRTIIFPYLRTYVKLYWVIATGYPVPGSFLKRQMLHFT